MEIQNEPKKSETCEKLSFDTYYEAKRSMGNISKGRVYGKGRRRTAIKNPKQIYKCEYCGKFHLTTQKKKRKQ